MLHFMFFFSYSNRFDKNETIKCSVCYGILLLLFFLFRKTKISYMNTLNVKTWTKHKHAKDRTERHISNLGKAQSDIARGLSLINRTKE